MNTGCMFLLSNHSLHIHMWQVMLKRVVETLTGRNGLCNCQILTRIGICVQDLVAVPVICSSNNTHLWSDANIMEFF